MSLPVAPQAQVDGSWRVKVADFNVSKIVEGTAVVTSSLAVHNPRSEGAQAAALACRAVLLLHAVPM